MATNYMTANNSATPREKLLKDTAGQLNALLHHHGIDVTSASKTAEDTHSIANAIMREFERRSIGKVGDRLIFCDPDMPVEFIEG